MIAPETFGAQLGRPRVNLAMLDWCLEISRMAWSEKFTVSHPNRILGRPMFDQRDMARSTMSGPSRAIFRQLDL